VIEIGKSEDGRAAATLNLGRFGVANALVEDLSIEADVNPMTPNDGRSLMAIKVGDTVTWRSSANPNAIGFSGCRVIEIGKSEDGRAAATLNLGRFGVANALVEDLSIEADELTP
jgi:hypothetical protein